MDDNFNGRFKEREGIKGWVKVGKLGGLVSNRVGDREDYGVSDRVRVSEKRVRQESRSFKFHLTSIEL